MYTKSISRALLEFAVVQHRDSGIPIKQLTSTRHLSRASFYRAQRQLKQLGYIKDPGTSSGARSKIDGSTMDWLLSVLRLRPTIYLDEIRDLLRLYHNISISISSISHWLKKANITLKKLSRAARQRDQARRGTYAMRMTQYSPELLVFADETHFNNRNALRANGWAPANKRASVSVNFQRGTKWSLLPALAHDGIFAAFIVKGSITKERFLYWLEHFALPNMNAFPAERSVLVVDNASVQKGPEVRELVEQHGVHLIYLPPYSPDLNPIELAFSSIKSRLRRDENASRLNALCACDRIQAPHARSFFQSCGYGR